MRDLDKVVSGMYESISFEAGGRPDWERQATLFAPDARMVRVNDDGIFEFDFEAYRIDFERMISSGEMPSFWEGELWRDTQVFDNVAHVLSAYETRRTRNGPLLNRGVNSIQLFRRDGHWLVSAMIWRREGRQFKIADGPPR